MANQIPIIHLFPLMKASVTEPPPLTRKWKTKQILFANKSKFFAFDTNTIIRTNNETKCKYLGKFKFKKTLKFVVVHKETTVYQEGFVRKRSQIKNVTRKTNLTSLSKENISFSNLSKRSCNKKYILFTQFYLCGCLINE